MVYDEFRLMVMPDIQVPGSWAIQVHRCPIAAEVGPKGTTIPTVTRAQLNRLRNPNGWPDEHALRQLGTEVWNSLMTPRAAASFHASSALARSNGHGLRVVISLLENGSVLPGSPVVSLSELPIEALYDTDFISSNESTPISRSLQTEPDRAPFKTAFPLRVLIVAAQPADRPPVKAEEEVAAIQRALQPLVDKNAIVLDRCLPPTIDRLMEKLDEGHHILHFVGHGSFETVGNDPIPKPHVCFEDGTAARDSVLFDGDQLYLALRNTSVQLVVLTSCSSSTPGPAPHPYPVPDPYPVIAFEGIAQRLVDGASGPSAVVAMQFDLETTAAEVFSGVFYQALVKSEWALDEAVARARAKMRIRLKPGHRCFVNPVVYWRSIDGKIFDLIGAVGDGLTPEDQKQISQIDAQLEAYYQTLREIANQPEQIRTAAEPLRITFQAAADGLLQQRGGIMGETLRLVGGRVAPDQSVDCRVTLRLRTAGVIGDVSARLEFDTEKVILVGSSEGTDTPGNVPFLQSSAPGIHTVLIQNVSKGAALEPREYELARLRFHLVRTTSEALLQIRIAQASVSKDGQPIRTFRTMDAVVFPS